MSVFQDVTAAPLIVIVPVLGLATDAQSLALSIVSVLAKAALAFALVYFAGRWVLRPFFGVIAERRSGELFTLTVLLVSLTAAWLTSSLGLSMAFGAFLVGMMLGETEFRHQVESAVRPFRDVLLGLFFIGIGMLFDLSAIGDIWYSAVAGTVARTGIPGLIMGNTAEAILEQLDCSVLAIKPPGFVTPVSLQGETPANIVDAICFRRLERLRLDLPVQPPPKITAAQVGSTTPV